MAEKIAAVEDFLTCPICLETFKEPVSLGCNHSFCSSCLHNYWDQNNTKDCPVCRRRSSKDNVLVNFALKELSISFSKKVSLTQSESGEGEAAGEGGAVCSKHPDVTHILCLDESQVFCPVCDHSLHTNHKVAAVSELKQQLKTNLKSLKKKRSRVSAVQQSYEEMVRHSDTQAAQCERHIRAVFNRLHQLLKEEESRALEDLREEQHRQTHTISPHLENIREQQSSLDLSISTVEKHLQKENKDFITDYRQTQTTAHTLITQTNPKLVPGLLINQAKVLGNLGFKVWEKTRDMVHYSPVILDPNTADESLYLSEDLTSVNLTDPYQQVPDNPERYSQLSSVLGSEGFTSGRHQWVVEVGDHPSWTIGVAEETVDRKGDDDSEDGYWGLDFDSGKYTNVVGDRLKLKWRPKKIQVCLDYDEGEVSFYNAKGMNFICSHKKKFTEKLFPYFNIGPVGDAKTKHIKICSSEHQE